MPLFVLVGHDGPRGPELRPVHRPEHLAHLEPLAASARIVFAGPLIHDGKPRGSVVIFEASDLAAARALAARDPYVTRGIFERYDVYETSQVFPLAP